MSTPRTLAAILGALVTSTPGAVAQRPPIQPDSSRAQIQVTLRAFYFNLARQDWDALTADILPAKIVAHRPAPEGLVTAAVSPGAACSSTASTLVNQATLVDRAIMTFDGDWAAVSISHCGAPLAGTDQFRLIRFESRWRFVYIHLFEQPMSVSSDR